MADDWTTWEAHVMAEVIEDVLDRFMAALSARDGDALQALHTEDATIWHGYDAAPIDAATHLARLADRIATYAVFDITVQRRFVLPDQATAIQEVVITTEPADGRRRVVPACQIVEVRDGRIAAMREYLDRG